MATSVEQFVRHFVTEARAIGLSIQESAPSGESDVRVILATIDAYGLRLLWSESSQTLALEISQGPPGGGIAGWLPLHKLHCEGGQIPPQDAPEDTLEDALDYGLELCTVRGRGT